MGPPKAFLSSLHTVSNRVPASLPRVDGDEDRLQQILYNLIGNAVKYTEVGSIIIDADAGSRIVNLSVSDTGIGIPEDEQSRIFESFEQVAGAADREFSGTGLGLSISKKLVELHGGTITVDSSR